MKTLIIGKGELGKSLAKVLQKKHSVLIKDKKYLQIKGIEMLHICYPFFKDFVKTTKEYIKQYQPRYTIIHSTVPMGTSRECGAWHSPIRGMHPNLETSIITFVKYIGGKKNKRIKEYFNQVGIKTKFYNKPEITELLKILSTTYYAWNIVFSKEVKKICDQYKLNFQQVYLDANRTYNEGYKKLGKTNVIRPILKPIKGKIGGHCIINNCHLLNNIITKTILTFNQKYGL